MNKNYYAPIRRRKDGSIFIDKHRFLKDFLGFTSVILMLVLFFTVILLLSLFYTPGTRAQEFEKAFVTPETLESSSETASGLTNEIHRIALKFPVSGRMTSGYGYRSNPFGGMSSKFHTGQDIAAPRGTPVSAAADGEIVFAGWQRGYGNIIIINHTEGISTRYAHLSHISVKQKDFVTRGMIIGSVGSTGRSTGAHLHYEVRINDKSVDPLNYLPETEVIH